MKAHTNNQKENIITERASYPRVSDIISPFTREAFDKINPDVLENAANRGTKVHEYCSAIANDVWCPTIDEECKAYVESFQQWFVEHVEKVLHTDTRLYDDVKRFTGSFDMIVKLTNGRVAIVDLKTSSSTSPSWALQLAAYHHLASINGFTEIDTMMNIHLKKTGKIAKVIEYHNIDDLKNIFNCCIICYDHFYRKKEKTNE